MLKWKTTKLQAEIEHVYWIFLLWSWVILLTKQKLQSYNPKSNTYTEYFGPGKGLKWKTTKLQAEIEHIYWIFLPFSGVKMKNYKATSWNRTYILDILVKDIIYSSLETKTTKLQPKIEHIYRIFLPWSGVKMKNYKTTSWNRTYTLNILPWS